MARLPWQHTRARTKSNSEKSQPSEGQGWFARNTAEPSRQALVDLVKAHKRESSGDSCSSRARSRGTTITSPEWQNGRSRSTSITDEIMLTKGSPTRMREGSIYSTAESNSSKNILSKGGLMLRRTGSKLSLSSAGSSSTMGLASPPRITANASNAGGRDEMRSKISAPFDFQHVTHTEQTHFPGLHRIEENELAHRFSSIATDQSAAPELRGIQASAISTSRSLPQNAHMPHPMVHHSTPCDAFTIPRRPAPPPKDTLVSTSPSRAVPAEHSLSTTTIIPHSQASQLTVVPIADASFRPDDVFPSVGNERSQSSAVLLEDKPLPRLPIIHAVTTADDTARAMISAPLPTPPANSTPSPDPNYFARTAHQRQKSSIALPRHMVFYPSNKVSMPNLHAAAYLDATNKSFPRHRSDLALSSQRKPSPPACHSRASTNFGPLDTCNWEDAVDEAWNDADDIADREYDTMISQHSALHEERASQSTTIGHSAGSTPLMMAGPPRLHFGSFDNSFDSAVETNSSNVTTTRAETEDKQQISLAGLGIASCPPIASQPSPVNFSRSSSLRLPRHNVNQHSPNESLTRSSSQESIILSIASSINGTQRSSSSSVLVDEMLNMSRIQEDTIGEASEEGEDKVGSQSDAARKTRPESGCLPFGMIEQIAPGPAASENYVKHPPLPATTSIPVHKHSKSTPKVPVPARRSSILASDITRPSRVRSNTTGTSVRPSSRISYSLFPTPSPNAVTI